MKVGILTTLHAYNYGALLQAYSLQQVLNNQLSCDSEVINFNPLVRKREDSIYYPNTNVRNFIRNILLFFNRRTVKMKKCRINKFNKFKNNIITHSKIEYIGVDSLKDSIGKYDCYVCGSDQVWNMSLFDGSYYFLDFLRGTKVNRFSYAPSVLQPINNTYRDEVIASLSEFNAISVREREDVDVISKLSGRDVCRVIDPVFLNTTEFWKSKERQYSIKEPYILCYFLGGDNAASPIINEIKRLTGLKVCSFNLSYKKQDWCDIDCTDADPFEFLYLINHASYICTNSFHCTAFSILFHKNFYLMAMNEKRNSRMLNLIEDYDLKNRIVHMEAVPDKLEPIDYSRVDEKVDKLRCSSLDFIKTALN